jgi:hypothetical protein
MSVEPEIIGFEFDWFGCCDADGFVGHFSTAGSGVAPPAVLLHPVEFNRIYEEILALPASSDAAVARDVQGKIVDWLEFARRGLYSFDSDYSGGPYRLIARPTVARRVGEFPASVADVIRTVVLDRVRIHLASVLQPADLGCSYAPPWAH